MSVSFLEYLKIITGTKEIGDLIYSSPPPTGTTFAITGGADKNLFTINPNTGELSFTSIMLYQTPLDFDRDGIYDVIITATESDGTINTGNLSIEVSLDNTTPEFKDTNITYEINADGATVIKVSGTLTDDLSGMIGGTIGITIKHAISGQTISLTSGGETVYVAEDGSYELTYTMDAGLPDGLWYVSYLGLEDKAGNKTSTYYSGAGTSILSAELPNELYLGGTDKVLPEFKDTNITYEINADGATVIKVSGSLTDDLSGMIG
ncbi:MAG: hypothetical protein CMA02_05310, partial [Euryarchaeota archaeon]|nr:hypothetical protein [Euryarchaeota archaeon]